MRTLPTYFKSLIFIIAISIVTNCKKGDDGPIAEQEDTTQSSDVNTNQEGDNDELDKETNTVNLEELIANTEELEFLNEAITVANLNDVLSDENPLTVFAPSNEAIQLLFDFLGESYSSFSDFDSSIEKIILQDIIKYHFVAENLPTTSMASGMYNTLQNDQTFLLTLDTESFTITDATTTVANSTTLDLDATNGTLHIIDKILISQETADLLADIGIDINNPPNGEAIPTLKEFIIQNESFSVLKEALELTNLLDRLGEEGPFTVLLPTNNSIGFILSLAGNNELSEFDTAEEISLLKAVLSYHIINGIHPKTSLEAGELETLAGEHITIAYTKEFIDFTGEPARITTPDIPAKNGIIHVIDRILIPEQAITQLAENSSINNLGLTEILAESPAFIIAIVLAQDYLDQILNNNEPFTLFVPEHTSFLNRIRQIPTINSLQDLNSAENASLLADVISYHHIPNTKLTMESLTDGLELTTQQGNILKVLEEEEHKILVDVHNHKSKILNLELDTTNASIFSIESVLLPY
jgi:transforming growth factor-beta-induced protein